jgi:hypothetical protein
LPFCPKCGTKTLDDSRFCPSCGYNLKTPSAVTQPTYRQEPIKQRPTGVSILAVLQILGGIFFFGFGIILLILAGFVGIAGFIPDVSAFPAFIGGTILGIIGGVMLVIGVLSFVVAYGYWNGLSWAWTIGIVITVIGLIVDLVSLPQSIIGLILSGIILYYLTRPNVKRWFGKEPVTVTV